VAQDTVRIRRRNLHQSTLSTSISPTGIEVTNLLL